MAQESQGKPLFNHPGLAPSSLARPHDHQSHHAVQQTKAIANCWIIEPLHLSCASNVMKSIESGLCSR
jgi:hypothetical protein